jgi:MFS family permease
MPEADPRRSARPSVLMLAAFTGLTALSIDMSLPAMPQLQRSFDAGAGAVQLTLSLFLAGFAAGQLVCGVVADRVGRRPALLVGLALFTVAGLTCAASPSLPVLIAAPLVAPTLGGVLLVAFGWPGDLRGAGRGGAAAVDLRVVPPAGDAVGGRAQRRAHPPAAQPCRRALAPRQPATGSRSAFPTGGCSRTSAARRSLPRRTGDP